MELKAKIDQLDKRNLGLDIEGIAVLAADQRRLRVDAFVRWRINDPLRYYQRFRTEDAARSQLNRITTSAIREVLGDVPVPEIVSGQRAQLMGRGRGERGGRRYNDDGGEHQNKQRSGDDSSK